MVLANEFRDGNVPAMMAPLAVAERALAAPSKAVTSYFHPGDSASDKKALLHSLRDENRAEVDFVLEENSAHKNTEPLQRAMIRIRPRPASDRELSSPMLIWAVAMGGGSLLSHAPDRPSWVQRIIACLLLILTITVIVNPLWECHDHLDSLRHLGPHGILMIMLSVACAGLCLLKSLRWLSLSVLYSILRSLRTFDVVSLVSHKPLCAMTSMSPLPLRI